jgi:hypothetical protein
MLGAALGAHLVAEPEEGREGGREGRVRISSMFFPCRLTINCYTRFPVLRPFLPPSLPPFRYVRVSPHDAGLLLLPHLPRQGPTNQGVEAGVQPNTVDDTLYAKWGKGRRKKVLRE